MYHTHKMISLHDRNGDDRSASWVASEICVTNVRKSLIFKHIVHENCLSCSQKIVRNMLSCLVVHISEWYAIWVDLDT